MAAEFDDALIHATADPRVVGLVVTGAGRGFCAGADLTVLAERGAAGGPGSPQPDAGDPTWGEDFRGVFTSILSVPKPVVAAVNGAVAGMALALILACDLRFMDEDAKVTTTFRPARPRRGVGHELAAPPARRCRPCARSPALGARGPGRRGRASGAGEPVCPDRNRARGRHGVCAVARRIVFAGLDGDDQAAGLPAAARRARWRRAGGGPIDGGELLAARLPRRCRGLPGAPTAALRPARRRRARRPRVPRVRTEGPPSRGRPCRGVAHRGARGSAHR